MKICQPIIFISFMYKIRREQQKQQQTHFRQLSFDHPQIYKSHKQENTLKVPFSKIFRRTQFIEDYNLYSNRNQYIDDQNKLLPRSKGLYSQFSDDAETGYIEQLSLKNQAIEKASKMIILLKEENDELKTWKQKMKKQLQIKRKQVQYLKEQLKQKQLEQYQSKIENNFDHNKTIIRGLNCENNKVSQNMIFSFTRNKDTIKKQGQIKIGNIDDQSYKYNVSAISNKLQEYKSNIDDQICGFTLNKLYQNISLTIAEQNSATGQFIVQEINGIIGEEEEIIKDYQIKMEFQTQQFSDQNNYSDFNHSQNDWLEIITLLRNCIQQYRQYSSYLRAYLCESINMIHDLRTRIYQDQNECLKKQKYIKMDFWRKIQQKILNYIKTEKRKKDKEAEENSELKEIIDELVENIQKTNLLNNN